MRYAVRPSTYAALGHDGGEYFPFDFEVVDNDELVIGERGAVCGRAIAQCEKKEDAERIAQALTWINEVNPR